jgi:hypothetical protein
MVQKAEFSAIVDWYIHARTISRGLRSRAINVLELVAAGAEEQGLAVSLLEGRFGTSNLGLALGDHSYEVHLREATSYAPTKMGGLANVHNGSLELRLRGPGLIVSNSRSEGLRWRDQRRSNLESKVPLLLAAIEKAKPAADEEARRWARAQVERKALQVERENAQRRATEESRREALLLDMHARWTRARDLRGLAKELRDRASALYGDERREAEEWLEWVDAYIGRIDPVNQPITSPKDKGWAAWL